MRGQPWTVGHSPHGATQRGRVIPWRARGEVSSSPLRISSPNGPAVPVRHSLQPAACFNGAFTIGRTQKFPLLLLTTSERSSVVCISLAEGVVRGRMGSFHPSPYG